jgi:hypothetical protein
MPWLWRGAAALFAASVFILAMRRRQNPVTGETAAR